MLNFRFLADLETAHSTCSGCCGGLGDVGNLVISRLLRPAELKFG